MTAISQHLVLSCEDSLDRAHQCTTLTSKIAIYFFAEIGFKQVTTTNCDTKSNDSFFRAASSILEDGVAGVQSTTLQEHPAKGSTRTFWCNKKYIHIFWRNDTRLLIERDSKSV